MVAAMKGSPTRRLILSALLIVSLRCGRSAAADEPLRPLLGDWSLTQESGQPAWMRITLEEGEPRVAIRFYVGPAGPYEAQFIDGGLTLTIRRRERPSRPGSVTEVTVRPTDDGVAGTVERTFSDGRRESDRFVGHRIPPMPEQPPDLDRTRFGHPIALFNGRDLTGWQPHEPGKINGWRAIDGELVNQTPKTDFSATGDHANLRTVAEFGDFWLHLEFLIEPDRNSGVYLRGTYEAQVVDRDSRMQGLQGVGAIFGAIAPSENAGYEGGRWQTYDLTLVDRHVTVVLNGRRVIDNQPVSAPTAGAIVTDPTAPGPIYLQGDHTAVRYRNLYLAPVIRD